MLFQAFAGRSRVLRDEGVRARLVTVAGAAFTGLLTILAWQTGRGQSLIHPDAATLLALAALMVVTAGAAAAVLVAGSRRPVPSGERAGAGPAASAVGHRTGAPTSSR